MPTEPSRTLVLIRHGESTWNSTHLVQGQDDEAELTAAGREQARAAGANLRSDDFDLIVSSDLTRTRQTADVLAEVLGLSVDIAPELRERHYGVHERRPTSELSPAVTGIGTTGRVVDEHARPEGGESLRELRDRAGRFLVMVPGRWPGQRLLIVTHGGTIRALRAAASGRAMQDLEWDPVTNCSVWHVELPDASR